MSTSTLWQQILAAPGDETLKDRYISALKKAGDPKAEIFRLVEALEQFPPYYVQHEGIYKQYVSSLTEWRTELEAHAQKWQAEVSFQNGWPCEITISARDFLLHSQEIVGILPLRHLFLTAVRESPKVFACTAMGQIASLNGCRQPWSHEAIQALAVSPNLSSLRWLSLYETELTDAEVEILAASPNLREVEYIDLRGNPCRDPVDASLGYGTDWQDNSIIPDSIFLPEFGKELEARYGTIGWLHSLAHFMEKHPPYRYAF